MTKKDNHQVNQNVSWELHHPYQTLKNFTSLERYKLNGSFFFVMSKKCHSLSH